MKNLNFIVWFLINIVFEEMGFRFVFLIYNGGFYEKGFWEIYSYIYC